MPRILKRAIVSGASVAIVGLMAHALFSSTAKADAIADCTSATLALPNPIYVSGSSAIKSGGTEIGKALAKDATPTTLIYVSKGSCDGVNGILSGTAMSGTGIYFDSTGTQQSCNVPAKAPDLGVSDVFPTSCTGVDQAALDAAKVGDFHGPVQSMNFVAPIKSDENSISAEAAYLAFGFDDGGDTTWGDKALHLIRNDQSGTQKMIGKAINVPANKMIGTDEGGGGTIVTDIQKAYATPSKVIGILSSNDADGASAGVKKLAFQGYGQTCAYWPDSDVSKKDKAYVRDGHYQIWGPSHLLAKLNDTKVPADPKVATLIDILTRKTSVTGVDVLALEIAANTTPLCAMKVIRDSELGPLSSGIPDFESCGCYFDSLRGDASACTTCNKAADCKDPAASHCNHGYCEVK